MKAYKGFNKDMTCRGFKFEEGKEYHEDSAVLCDCGFHACEAPLDCFGYYSPAESVYHEVELDEVSDERESDSKICGKNTGVPLLGKHAVGTGWHWGNHRAVSCLNIRLRCGGRQQFFQ